MNRTRPLHHLGTGAIAAGVALLAACAEDATLHEPTQGTPAEPPQAAEASVDLADGTAQAVELGRFRGRYDAQSGEFTLENIPMVLDERALDGVRSVQQQAAINRAGFCNVAVAPSDGTPNSAPANTVEVYSVDGTTGFDPSVCAALADDEFYTLPAGFSALDVSDFYLTGVFCSSVMVRSFLSVPLTDVYAEITTFVGSTSQFGYRYPLATGAAVPDAVNPPSNTFGLWFYDDLSPGDGDVGSSQNPPDERIVQWSFRFATTTDFEFEGRIVSMASEVCTDTIDNNCNGIINERCELFGFNAPCTDDADCQSFNCDAGFCATSTCDTGLQELPETDVDCGGGCSPCDIGQSCLVDADCTSDMCRLGECAEFPNPVAGEVIFSELLVNGPESVSEPSEFIEVYNASTRTLDLATCRLRDGGSENHEINASVVIAPGEYAVLARSGDSAENLGLSPGYVYGGTISLANGPDQIRLECGGAPVDTMAWSSTGNLVSAQGRTLSVSADALSATGNDSVVNICWGMTPYDTSATYAAFGTPGAANPTCNTQIAGCSLLTPVGATGAVLGQPYLTTGSVETTNPATTAVSPGADRWHRFYAQAGTGPSMDAPDSPSWQWSNSVYPNSGSGTADNFSIFAALPPMGGFGYSVAMRVTGDNGATWTYCDSPTSAAFASVDGYSAATAPTVTVYGSADTPDSTGELIFTEVLANEIDPGNNDEFIEIHNPGTRPLDLNTCTVTDAGGAVFTINSQVIVMPGGYAVLAYNSSSSLNGGLPVVNFDYSSLMLNISADSLLLRCSGVDIDFVEWSTSSFNGYTLQLHPSYLNDAANDVFENYWCQSRTSTPYGPSGNHFGTPGAPNDANCVTFSDCYVESPVTASREFGQTLEVQGFYRALGVTNRFANGGGPTTATSSFNNYQSGLVVAQLGIGPASEDPSTNPGAFSWSAAPQGTPSTGTSGLFDYDGLLGTITAPSTAGSYRLAYRLSNDGGITFGTYCDADKAGDGFQAASASTLDVSAPVVTTCELIEGPATASPGQAFTAGAIVTRPGTTDALVPTSWANRRIGYGPRGSQPLSGNSLSSSWTWVNAVVLDVPTSTGDPSDLYEGAFNVPSGAVTTDLDYTLAFSSDGANWFVCDTTERDVSTPYSAASAGQLEVVPATAVSLVHGSMPTTTDTATPIDFDVNIELVGPNSTSITARTPDAVDNTPDVTVELRVCDAIADGCADPSDDAEWGSVATTKVGGVGSADVWRANASFGVASTYDVVWRVRTSSSSAWLYSSDFGQPTVEVTVSASTAVACFRFSRYLESVTNTDKAVQIWNCGGTTPTAAFRFGVFNGGSPQSGLPLQTSNRTAVGSFDANGFYTFCNSTMSAPIASICTVQNSTFANFNGNDALILWEDTNFDGRVDDGEFVWDRIGDTDDATDVTDDVYLVRRNSCAAASAAADGYAPYTGLAMNYYFNATPLSSGNPPPEFNAATWSTSLASLECGELVPSDMVHVAMPTTATAEDPTVFTLDVEIPGLTDQTLDAADADPDYTVQIGYCDASGTCVAGPTPSGFTWTDATAVSGSGTTDRYSATIEFPANATAKTYTVLWRLRNAPVSPTWYVSTLDYAETAGSVNVAATAAAHCFLLSRYLEGASNDKAIQVWNCGGTTLSTLRIGGFNGGGSGTTLPFTPGAAVLSIPSFNGAGFYTFCNASINAGINSICDVTLTGSTNQVVNFNGNDPHVLWDDVNTNGKIDSGETVFDRIGNTNSSSNYAVDVRLVRKNRCRAASVPADLTTTYTSTTRDTFFTPSSVSGSPPTTPSNLVSTWNGSLSSLTCP